jgi:ABC-type multidrug transport system fused ATPase/permease subunit
LLEEAEINNNDASKVPKATPKKLVEVEKRASGSVKRDVYLRYLGAIGGIPFWTFILSIYFLTQALTLCASWWIKIWTASYGQENLESIGQSSLYAMQTPHIIPANYTSARFLATADQSGLSVGVLDTVTSLPFFQFIANMKIETASAATSLSAAPVSQSPFIAAAMPFPINTENRPLWFYITGYFIISLVGIIVASIRAFFVYGGSLRASKRVFHNLTYRVLRTPARWIDTTPTGRILNRFTADMQAMDLSLAQNFGVLWTRILAVVGALVAASIVSPYIIILALILLSICIRMGIRYIRGARSIRRLEAIQKSPLISHFTAATEGLSTIRAFATTEFFERRIHSLIDSFATATWHNFVFNTWISFQIGLIGSLFAAFLGAFVVSIPGIDSSLGGFALAFALQFRNHINAALRQAAETELDMNAAERIFEYSNLEIEDQGGAEVRASWPEKGELTIQDLEISYAADLPLILKGLTFRADMNQRIGIVGRTGAGK